ncbi:MAG TPA: transcriptional repressor LexA [Dehalococcoidia bacterium]|nr:transcriptional repressor LexA [Dehalococcoidia bacterium]
MKQGLSTRQEAILDFMRKFIDEHDYPPSIRDIQLGCGISSTSVVDYNLKALEKAGLIRRDREVSRAIELLDPRRGRRPRTVPVPIIGTIAAGQPIPVPSPDNIDYDNVFDATEDLTKGKENVFALKVRGTSMIDALVNDGDIVILEQTSAADDGDMVAAWLKDENEATLKKFYREGDRVRLQPANTTMKPIYTSPDNVEIQGRVLATIGRRD